MMFDSGQDEAVTYQTIGKRRKGMRSRTDIDQHVANRIRGLRISLGRTQQSVADAIGICNQQLFKYETGENRITANMLYLLAKTFGVDVGYFFSGADSLTNQKIAPRPHLPHLLLREFNGIQSRALREACVTLTRSLRKHEEAGSDAS